MSGRGKGGYKRNEKYEKLKKIIEKYAKEYELFDKIHLKYAPEYSEEQRTQRDNLDSIINSTKDLIESELEKYKGVEQITIYRKKFDKDIKRLILPKGIRELNNDLSEFEKLETLDFTESGPNVQLPNGIINTVFYEGKRLTLHFKTGVDSRQFTILNEDLLKKIANMERGRFPKVLITYTDRF